jgi:hypothetical protein
MFVSTSLASSRLEAVDFDITVRLGGRETGIVAMFVFPQVQGGGGR